MFRKSGFVQKNFVFTLKRQTLSGMLEISRNEPLLRMLSTRKSNQTEKKHHWTTGKSAICNTVALEKRTRCAATGKHRRRRYKSHFMLEQNKFSVNHQSISSDPVPQNGKEHEAKQGRDRLRMRTCRYPISASTSSSSLFLS